MVRQISVLPAASKSQAPDGEEGADLADWLSRDLRAKGTPSRPPPGDVTQPSDAPPPADPEASALVGWLARDLTPKHSVRPHASAAPVAQPAPLPSEHLPAAPIAPVPIAVIEAAPFAPALDAKLDAPPGEAVAPELEPAVAGAVTSAPGGEPTALASTELQEDDLSVLPGRRRTVAPGGRPGRRKKLAALLLVALVLGAGGLLLRRAPSSSGEGVAAVAAAAPAEAAAALLPPPPEEAAPVQTPVEPAAAPRHRGGPAEPEAEPGLADPRSFLGGPSVRRYADVASPTLSRLAAEQRRLARERDEAARRAAAAAAAENQSAKAEKTAGKKAAKKP